MNNIIESSGRTSPTYDEYRSFASSPSASPEPRIDGLANNPADINKTMMKTNVISRSRSRSRSRSNDKARDKYEQRESRHHHHHHSDRFSEKLERLREESKYRKRPHRELRDSKPKQFQVNRSLLRGLISENVKINQKMDEVYIYIYIYY